MLIKKGLNAGEKERAAVMEKALIRTNNMQIIIMAITGYLNMKALFAN
jgi:hypothetical protein